MGFLLAGLQSLSAETWIMLAIAGAGWAGTAGTLLWRVKALEKRQDQHEAELAGLAVLQPEVTQLKSDVKGLRDWRHDRNAQEAPAVLAIKLDELMQRGWPPDLKKPGDGE